MREAILFKPMNYYFAPLEGLTDSIYRRLHHKYFPGVDRYYMPFMSPTVHRVLTNREDRELPPADSVDFCAIPQLLTKNAEDFLWAAEKCLERGYQEVNLNVGCPSGTVVSKGKGAGMLSDPENLNRFLEEVFAHTPIPVSIKTRLGVTDPGEFVRLLDIYNQYPVAELIIHPRVRKDFYDTPIKFSALQYACENSKNPVCFNGNLCSVDDIAAFHGQYPHVSSVMLGRGLIGDPGMLSPGGTDSKKLEAFYVELLENYIEVFGGSRNAMFRLKENWRYLLCRFEDSEKIGKRLRKTTDVNEYRAITAEIFRNHPLKQKLEPDW